MPTASPESFPVDPSSTPTPGKYVIPDRAPPPYPGPYAPLLRRSHQSDDELLDAANEALLSRWREIAEEYTEIGFSHLQSSLQVITRRMEAEGVAEQLVLAVLRAVKPLLKTPQVTTDEAWRDAESLVQRLNEHGVTAAQDRDNVLVKRPEGASDAFLEAVRDAVSHHLQCNRPHEPDSPQDLQTNHPDRS